MTNPFLSQLPAARFFCSGHFPRFVPNGYLEHLRDGVTPVGNRRLNKYYQAIEQITRSRNMFSLPRLKTVSSRSIWDATKHCSILTGAGSPNG